MAPNDAFQVGHDQIARLALDAYHHTIPPRGAKPGLKSNGRLEWTILAAFILSHPTPDGTHQYTLISLGTGLKCLPYTSLPPNGDVLHDQHAEVLARRGARQWLLKRLVHEVKLSADEMGFRLFEQTEKEEGGKRRWRLSKGVRLHLYVSTLPCGDASNSLLGFQRAAQDEAAGRSDVPTPAELLQLYTQGRDTSTTAESSSSGASSVVRGRASSTTHHQSTHAPGSLRTKPGRPDSPPSISMTCSDKLALWNAPGIGIQGSLLSSLIEPIHIHSITMCDGPTRHVFPSFPLSCADSDEYGRQREELKKILAEDCRRALQRARSSSDEDIVIGWSTAPFADGKEVKVEQAWSAFEADSSNNGKDLRKKIEQFKATQEPVTCPNSVLYISNASLKAKGKAENLATGTKMGAPTKRPKPKDPCEDTSEALKPQARSIVCKLNWFQTFSDAYIAITGSNLTESGEEVLYSDAKEGFFGEGTKAYRKRKEELLGGRGDAQKVVERFLSGARDRTAIKRAEQDQVPVLLVGEEAKGDERELWESKDERVFKGWLRTPASLSHFDLHGRGSHQHTAT